MGEFLSVAKASPTSSFFSRRDPVLKREALFLLSLSPSLALALARAQVSRAGRVCKTWRRVSKDLLLGDTAASRPKR